MNFEPAPWQHDQRSSQEVRAAVTILTAIFILPSILHIFAGAKLSGALIALISTLCGMTALFHLSPAQCAIKKLCWRDVWVTLLVTSAALLFSGTASTHWQAFLKINEIGFAPKQDVLTELPSISRMQIIMLVISTCVTTPVIEEILFRRIIYGAFLKSGVITAFILTSILFGAVHFFLAGLPGLTILGMGFHIAFLMTGNLSSAILSHMLVNLIATGGVLFKP